MDELLERLLDLPEVKDVKLVSVDGGYGVILRTIYETKLITDHRIKHAVIGAIMVSDQRL